MLEYTITKEQEKELRGLAYHIADLHHFLERYGAQDNDLPLFRSNVVQHFSRMDALKIPYTLQNAVICFAEEWRAYLQDDLLHALEKRGYNIAVKE